LAFTDAVKVGGPSVAVGVVVSVGDGEVVALGGRVPGLAGIELGVGGSVALGSPSGGVVAASGKLQARAAEIMTARASQVGVGLRAV
jgi:hypothetical protein